MANENNLESLRDDINDFDKYSLNAYHHKSWVTLEEGSKLCDFILSLITHIESLESRISEYENKDK